MFCVTLKVLIFRYAYMIRQRWLLTISYLLFPLILCFLAVLFYESVELEKHRSPFEEHNELSLLRIPEKENCTSLDGQNDCQLKVVVCPGGAKERELMDIVVSMLRLSDNTSALEILYVNNSDFMTDVLVRLDTNYSRGLHFLEISSSKLEYTIRPRALQIPAMLYDWGDYATTQRFPSPMFRGPRLTDPYFNIEENLHKTSFIVAGFLPLQVAVDKAYIETYFPNASKEWSLTSFPYPHYYELPAGIRQFLSQRMFLILTQYTLMMGITFMISVFASYTISDKMSGIREWMCLNGAIRWMVNLSWLVSFCFEATIVAIVEVVILKMPTLNGPTIKYMSEPVLTLFLVVYNWLSLCWVNLFATVLKSQVLCVLIIIAYWIFSPLFYWIPPDLFLMQGLLATIPNAGMILIFKSFQEFDGAETVLDLNRLHSYPIHYLPVGILLLIMFATVVLLVLLGIYADLVSPGPFGRAKPWYLFNKKGKMQDPAGHEESPNEEKHFEEIVSKDPIGLECERISKYFRTRKIPWRRFRTAISNVSMEIPKNKITVLLGPNGAGKTTLFSILCGMYSPSTGHFYTEEYDVFQGDNITEFRKALGYCPQNNLLMNELTVRQHLIICGLLKGLSRNEAEESSKNWTKGFDMKMLENTKARELSGGTKRKLCLAIAMTGDPQYLLLDEPSSGLDAKTRRTFWNVLLQEKSERTIVLTTHDMDEAEALGDRVALLVNGQLMGYGSSSFLKKQLGTGYKLKCTFNETDRMKVLQFVRNVDRSISLLYEMRNTITLGIPLNKSEAIPNLLKSLKSEFGDRITASLSDVTMEDVFIKFQSGSKTGSPPNYVDALEITEDDIDRSRNCEQIKGIFKKKIEWMCNQSLITVIILLLIIPMIGIESALYFTNGMIGSGSSSNLHTVDLKLTMDAYSGKKAFILVTTGQKEDEITTALRRAMDTSNIKYESVNMVDMVDFLNAVAKRDLFEYRSQIVFAFDSGDEVSEIPTAYYSRNAFHSAPIAYSALLNAILHGKTSITTHNFPFVKELKGESCLDLLPHLVASLFQIFLGPILLISGSYFIIFPHIERKTLFKHRQLMTGLLPWVYWISHLMFDMLIFSITVLLIIVILAADNNGLFSDGTVMLALIIVLLLYGTSIITFAYAFSFFRCSTSIVVIWFISVHLIVLLGYAVSTFYLHYYFSLNIKTLYFFPWVILEVSLNKILLWASSRKACYHCEDAQACAFISTPSLIGLLKAELVSFVIISLIYFAFILAMDHGFGRKLKPIIDRICHGEIEYNDDDIDPHVAREKRRVRDLEMNQEGDQPELICDGLGKKYSYKVTAVRDVTFVHERGKVFGLLGVNSSGKSTTLGMLSGLISPTSGSATVRGKWELGDCEYKYIKNIGFCPQYGGILPGLSGRNTLRLFARLRGVKPSLQHSHVERWIKALDMVPLADRPCEQYSTGNKRKLSFAIAMMGYPSVVLLDEPTAGIDPVVRGRMLEMLSWRNSSQAIVFTSHITSECEAICDRLTIMVNGKMTCIGSVQELKNLLGNTEYSAQTS